MRIRREAANKLRGFSYNLNSSVGCSLNNTQENMNQENMAEQDGNIIPTHSQNTQNKQNPQTLKRFYQELEANLANDEDKILELLRKLLKMNPAKRTFRECMSIYKLLKSTTFMTDIVSNIGFKIAIRMCKHLVYEIYEEKQYIYKQGQSSDKAYILLSGKLGVIIKNKEQQDVIIGEVKKFEDFGKIEIENNIIRNSTILASKKSEVCCIEKTTYFDIIGQLKKRSSDYYLDNLLLFSCFQMLSKIKLLSLIPLINVKYYQRNQVIYKEKEQAKHVYFIIDGDFKQLSSVVVATNDYQGEYVLNTSHLTTETENLFKIRHSVRKIQLAIYSRGEIIGSEDLLNDDEIRTSELVCDSERGTLFCLARKDLEARIGEDDLFWQHLLDIALFKIQNKEKKLGLLRDPLRKTGINKEIILSSKSIAARQGIHPIEIKRDECRISSEKQNKLNRFEVHVNQCMNNSQERLQSSIQDINLTKSSLSNLCEKQKSDEQQHNYYYQIQNSLVSTDIPSAQQLDEMPSSSSQQISQNNSFLTQLIPPSLIRPSGLKKNIYSHRNSYLSNHTSSTYESNSGHDTQETTQIIKPKHLSSARQNFQIMNNTCSSGFSNILAPKHQIGNGRKERILSQECIKTQESFNLDQTTTNTSMTHRVLTKKVIRREALNSMDNLEILKSIDNHTEENEQKKSNKNKKKNQEQDNFENMRKSQIINQCLGGSTTEECFNEVRNNLRKKNIHMQEHKEFNDVHMNYSYLRQSRIDRNSMKINRIQQQLFSDINQSVNAFKNSNSQNDIDITKSSQISIKQIPNNQYKATYKNITPSTFFTSFKLNNLNNHFAQQQQQQHLIQNPRAIRSSYTQLKTQKEIMNTSAYTQRNQSQESMNNPQSKQSINQECSDKNRSLSTTQNDNHTSTYSEIIPAFNLFSNNTFENTRYKQVRIKKKQFQNFLNQSYL